MSEFLDRISKLSPQRLALLADELNERVRASEESRKVPLAIVGIGCRLPGGVQDAEGFWKLLSEGADAVCQVPPSRWDVEEFYDANPDTPGKMATRWGGFIDGHDQFDPKFFGIAPAEAVSMDPQQRLLLETSWEALEHAGIAPSALSGTSTGVYVGICNGDYAQVALNSPHEQITPHLAAGLSHAVAAGRISYLLGLQGPSLAVDTSCSASLVAVHLACQSLRLRECDAALAGGVNLILNPEVTIALSQSRMMAPDGKCKAFSDAANGFVRSEGCGMIVLKRLPDAVRDRNRILAIIRGSACNQDGRSSGLTAPNGPSQEAVVAAALADARLRADDVDYIEAHGTGTALGDPIELGALNAVFRNRSAASGPLLVGSVKTNLGHLESAAGIAGLIKLVLSIHHRKIPASLHFETPNSRVEWGRLPIQVPTRLQEWTRARGKRAGGVSSFGFSGTNAHVIVEEYVEENRPDTRQGMERSQAALPEADRPLLFLLSAKTESALQQIASRLAVHLREHPSLPLVEIARTLNTGRSHFEYRTAFVAASRVELLTLLDGCAKNDASMQMDRGRAAVHSPRAAFVFGDEQTFGINFARELYESAPVFRETLLRCGQILESELDRPLLAQLYPEIQAASGGDGLPTGFRRPAAFALQFALAELWRSCGIEPTAVCGYGVGELVAASVAGVFNVEHGLRLAVVQGCSDQNEVARRVRVAEYHVPTMTLVASGTEKEGIQVDSPDYWLRGSGVVVPSVAAWNALAREGCAANLAIGDSTLLQSIRRIGVGLEGKWLASLGDGHGSCSQLLNTAAALYVMGFGVDMDRFYSDVVANTIALPTYPFERERYWISTQENWWNDRGGNVTISSVSNDLPENIEVSVEDLIYELVWEPKPLPIRIPPRSAAGIEEEASETSSVTAASDELARIASLNRAATPIYATYILQALREAGLSPLPERAFQLAELSERLKIAPNRRRILTGLFSILLEDKIVERSSDSFRFIDFEPRPDADAELQRLGMEYPECRIELNILRRCGSKLAAVLRGSYDPMQLVFADGSVEEAEQVYEKSPVCRFFNEKTAETVRAAVARIERAEGRSARILEIGAGTGATTGPVLEGLRGANFEYCFTDISPVFLSRARVKFSDVPSIEYRILDVERDPADQNFQAGGYDIVLAANVLHATADLRRTLANVRKLLAPGGLLLLIEGVRPDRWLDLTFGLTDGWWRFVDYDLRPEHPLISADTWKRVLDDVGIGSVRTIAYALVDGTQSQQTVIAGRAGPDEAKSPRKVQKEWLIFADRLGIGDALAKSLNDLGKRCETIQRPDTPDEVSVLLEKLRCGSDNAELEVVYLWGVDAAGPIVSAAALQTGTEFCGKTPIHLIQALQRSGKAARIFIVTRGAQATADFAPNAGGAVQSLAWGIGRVLGLESPERYGALIDVDPAMSPEAAAASVIAELFSNDREDQIVYRDGQRLVARLRRSSLQKSAANTAAFIGLREDGAYLLVGGLGGVGLEVAKWAAKQHAGHLVLLGRTGIGTSAGAFASERQTAIQQIEKLGTRVTIVEGDVASEADMSSLFRRFGRELPSLRGIFHAATVVHAMELANLTDKQIDDMLRPKVLGTWILHELTKDLDLDFFLAFSSTTSLLGAKGMAHYAAANQFLDSFAHFRHADGLPMLSVNWGAWNVMRLVSSQGQARLRQAGLLPMSSEKILGLFGDLLASRRAQIMIANINWNVLKPAFEVQRVRPLLEQLGGATWQQRSSNGSSIPELRRTSLLDTAAMTSADRSKFIEAFVLEHAAQVLGFRRGELPPVDVPLSDLGLDSLMAVDLKNRLQTGLGQELSATVVFDYPTVAALSGLLDTMLWAGDGTVTHDPASFHRDEIRI